jgi:hypothetical protein
MGGDYSSRNGFGSPVHPHDLDALLPELEGKRIDSTTASRISGDNVLDKGTTREFQLVWILDILSCFRPVILGPRGGCVVCARTLFFFFTEDSVFANRLPSFNVPLLSLKG